MTSNFNYVKCPKCEHDRNPSTATKCEICGTPLRKKSAPVVLVGAGLITLTLLGVGAYVLKDKLAGAAPQTVASPGTATGASNQSMPAATSPSVAIAPPVQGAVVATYHTLAEVPNVPQGVFQLWRLNYLCASAIASYCGCDQASIATISGALHRTNNRQTGFW